MKKSLIATGVAILAFASVASAQGYQFNTNLTVGSTGPDVTALQTWLIANGYSIPAISSGAASKGYFGSQTQAAVTAYQAAKGIPNTGFVGPLTRAALNGTSAAATTMTPASTACPAGFTCTPVAGTTTSAPVVGAPTGITTPGVSGTLTISQSGSVANGATFNTGQTVNIAGFKLQSGPSDMQVNTITADFNVRPWLYFSSFSLVNQTTGQVLVPATPISQASFTELTASEDYRYTLSGLNFVIPHGQTVNVVLSGQANTGISQSTGTYIDIIAATVRSVDGTGVVDTENLTSLTLPYANTTSPYGSVLYNGNQTANLISSIDPTSPSAQIVQTQSGSVTNSVPLAVYDIQAQNNSATLQSLILNVGVNGNFNSTNATLSNVFNTIQLQAGGQTYYGTISNGTPNGTTDEGTVTFNNNVNVPLPIGQNVPLKIVANINQGVTGVTASTSLVTSTSGNFVGVDANYNTPTVQSEGTILSAVTTFSTTAAFSVTAGSAPTAYVANTPTTVANTTGNSSVTWPFTFTVSAGSSPIYIAATPGSAVKIATDLAGTPGPLGTGAASSTQPVNISSTYVTGDTNSGLGTNATGSYYVPSNSSRTFTVNVVDNNFGNASTDSNSQVALTGIYYSSTQTNSGSTAATSSESVYTLPSSIQSPTQSLLKQ